MSKNTEKKIANILKATIVFASLAIVFLILSIVASVYSVNRTVGAIDSIGTVEYTAESKKKIDLAQSYYDSLDANLGLADKIENADKLLEAKKEYVRLGIKKAYLADKNGEAEETVKAYVQDARKTFEEYCSTGECTSISNYRDLLDLEEKYIKDVETAPPETSAPPESSEEEEPPELC